MLENLEFTLLLKMIVKYIIYNFSRKISNLVKILLGRKTNLWKNWLKELESGKGRKTLWHEPFGQILQKEKGTYCMKHFSIASQGCKEFL